MNILVTWGSKRGGTEGIARAIAEVLAGCGHAVTAVAASEAPTPDRFDAVIIGGALYANRWHRHARRYANRHARGLRSKPVWFFSSGPLDDSADVMTIEPTPQVDVLMKQIGVIEHVTFGGRLDANARGFVARSMAKAHAGDWRSRDRVNAWANEIARALASAKPRPAAELPAHAAARLVAYAVVPAALAFAISALPGAYLVIPLVFAIAAWRYFQAAGARAPLPTAFLFAAAAGVPALAAHGRTALVSATSLWLPVCLVAGVVWAIGAVSRAHHEGSRDRTTSTGHGA